VCGDGFGLVRLKFFELEFKLFEFVCDLFALLAEEHPLQLGDDQLEMFDLAVVADALLALRNQQCNQRFAIKRI
jgi:hypothetical protein